MATQVTITDEAAVKTIEKYAERKSVSMSTAAAMLVSTAKGRLNAVNKYAATHKPAPKAKVAKVKPAPKAKVAKAPKVKTPHRRKTDDPVVETVTQVAATP